MHIMRDGDRQYFFHGMFFGASQRYAALPRQHCLCGGEPTTPARQGVKRGGRYVCLQCAGTTFAWHYAYCRPTRWRTCQHTGYAGQGPPAAGASLSIKCIVCLMKVGMVDARYRYKHCLPRYVVADMPAHRLCGRGSPGRGRATIHIQVHSISSESGCVWLTHGIVKDMGCRDTWWRTRLHTSAARAPASPAHTRASLGTTPLKCAGRVGIRGQSPPRARRCGGARNHGRCP